METLCIMQKTGRTRSGIKLLPVLAFALIAVFASFEHAMGQKRGSNLSDWNVPPPLAPGNITKGNTTGKSAKSQAIILTLTDIPPAKLPVAPPAQMPVMPPVSTVYPFLNPPGQPATSNSGNETGQQDIPLPDAPDAPPLPQQSLQDEPVSVTADMPVPEAPDLPASPSQPVSSGPITTVKTAIPLMPGIINLAPPVLQTGGGPNIWSIPGIPENMAFKLSEQPAEEKGPRYNRKSTQKVKSDHLKAKNTGLKQKPK